MNFKHISVLIGDIKHYIPKCAYTATPLTKQDTFTAISCCPIVMGGREPRKMVPAPNGGYYIIEKQQCIGCTICSKKVPSKITMIDW